ncbi:Amidase [Ascochyta rabiei]|uniref:Carbon-nitrogen ligase activity, with glutamine as amido-N-donor n=1 Tax=Didymella rabiei TaxID=5454 RepID=A0A163MM45_DIDRA|nr:Amidase [Ascochyta rabiei]KZM28835.1 carbon-nitrogen ligase activity, with glutamine as amido-N-donor [Ascochyta rabiei]UPX18258.1 Amidase [Ascochyta rabiei]
MSTPEPNMGVADWRQLALSKRVSTFNKIPHEWLLPIEQASQYTETNAISVLDVPRSCGILTQQELDITENYDATELVQHMASGKLTSVDVVTAFCKRAAIAHQTTNCLTEIMFSEALARAHECDSHLEKTGETLGPLHGLPISLKDSFNVKGVQSTIGYVSFIAHPPATTNSAVVQILFDLGAVFFVKTNLPQTMMTADSHNNVFGRTLNPHNLSRTAGGSTGGEGALIAMKGSVLGVATDIAGSNRIPALCCGISSIKPTASRVPFAGGAPPGRLGSPGQILLAIGPCGRSIRDYELFLRAVAQARPWLLDPTALNIPWRTADAEIKKRKLRFGLIRSTPSRSLHPPIARALHSAAMTLKAAGHTMVLLDDRIGDMYADVELAWKYFMLDPSGAPFQHIQASGEDPIPSLKISGWPELKEWKPSLDALWEMNIQRAGVLKKYHNLVTGEQLDAILMPAYQAVAPKHDTYGLPIYTALVNLLDYPAGILPHGKANKAADAAFLGDKVTYEPTYDPEAAEGMPSHIQIVGKPLMDEELLEIMKTIEAVLKDSS